MILIPPDRAPVLPRDLPALRELVRSTGASLLVLDPIGGHFRPTSRVHDRSVLAELLALARETGCAVVGVHHTVKKGVLGGTAVDAIGGPPGGLSGASRAVYLYGHDPEDEDRRALACAKINGVDEPPALIIEHTTVEYLSGTTLVEAGLLRFKRESNARASQVLRKGKTHRPRDAECAEWLTRFLGTGPDCARPTREVRGLGEASGFGWQTVLRAGTQLAVQKIRSGGWGGDGCWTWRLPDDHPARDGAAI